GLAGAALHRAGTATAPPARLRRGLQYRFARRQDCDAHAAQTHPAERSAGLRANDRLPRRKFSLRAHSCAGPPALPPLRWFPTPPCHDHRNRRAREITSKLLLRQTPKVFASPDSFGVARHGESVPLHGGLIDLLERVTHSHFPSLCCQRAFENNFENP